MAIPRKQRKRAKRDLAEAALVIKRARKKGASGEDIELLEKLRTEAKDALLKDAPDRLHDLLVEIEELVEDRLPRFRPNQWWETTKAIFIAVLVAFAVRWLVAEPFRIPSGSMIPTLLIGDQLFVDKTAYGPDLLLPYINPDIEELKKVAAPRFSAHVFGKDIVLAFRKLWLRRNPSRGEVVVFRYPAFPDEKQEDYVKRVIGVPGDEVSIELGRLVINGEIQDAVLVGEYKGPAGEGGCEGFSLYEESLSSNPDTISHQVLHCDPRPRYWPYYEYGPVTVPEGMVLGMGDNRDRSYDSRAWGFIPISHIKGKALFIHLPLDPEHHYRPRWDRFFKNIR